MAFGVKYRSEFADNEGLIWKWDFEFDGYVASVNTMKPSGDPMDYEPLADSDDLYEAPIRGTQATLRIMASSLGQYDEFATIEPQQIRVSIYHGSTLYFRGWVQPGDHRESYDDYPYELSISATCGLGYLKELDYTPTTEGRISEDSILINDILSKIGATGFNEVINIYEANMDSGTGNSPIDQTYIHTDVFEDMTCYEALEYICKKWKAVVRHYKGVFWIYRPIEMTGATYVRKFTAVGTKTSEAIDYSQFISRSGISSDFRDTNGGVKLMLPTAKKITLSHDWGSRESWLKNWEFKAETFTRDTGLETGNFAEWTQVNGSNGVWPLSYFVSSEKDGIAIAALADYTPLSTLYYVEQTFGFNTRISSPDMLVLEFDYGYYKPQGVSTGTLPEINVAIRQGGFYLTEIQEDKLIWVPWFDNLRISITVSDGWSGWTHFKKQIMPHAFNLDGEISIQLLPQLSSFASIYACFKNIQFYVSSYELVAKESSYKGRNRQSTLARNWNKGVIFEKIIKEIKEKQYIITGATRGEDYNEDHILGDITVAEAGMDNVLEQFKGSLGYATVLDPHELKLTFVRNAEMNNLLSVAASTMLTITNKTGQVITVANLPDYDQFDINGWVVMLIDEDKTSTTDPTPTGDYTYKNFATIDRAANTLTLPDGYSMTAWEVGDNIAVYNPFLNYSFVGDQTAAPIVDYNGAPTWRSQYSINGGMFRHSDGRFIWIVNGMSSTTHYGIGFVSSTDMVTWTMGNSDAPVLENTDLTDCTHIFQVGTVHPDGSGGYYSLAVKVRTSDSKSETRIMYFDEDLTTITFSASLLSDTPYYGCQGGGILLIDGYYHISYTYQAQNAVDRELRVAKSATIEGTYTDYQTIGKGTDFAANDGICCSNNLDNFAIFDDGEQIYGIFGGTARWSESGVKGNRQYMLLDFDPDTEVWSMSTKGQVFINPIYYQDINSTYLWCGDHCGGFLAMFIESGNTYLSLTMKGTVYQAALLKYTSVGIIQPTSTWARRGVTESQSLLQITGGELALQRTTQRQAITSYPVYDRIVTDTAPHLNILGSFKDILNNITAGTGGNLLVVWENYASPDNYETLTLSGIDITSLINTSGDGILIGAGTSLTVALNDIIVVRLFAAKTSGDYPELFMVNDTWTSSDSSPIVDGWNEIELIAAWSGNASFRLFNDGTNVNCSLTGIAAYRKPRKFAFNQGSYSAKSRLWNMDIVEIKQ